MSKVDSEIVEAIRDLSRITLAVSGQFKTKSDAIRRLNELGIPGPRIAGILGMSSGDVASALSKANTRAKKSSETDER